MFCLYFLHSIDVDSRLDTHATDHRNQPRAHCSRAAGVSLLSADGSDSHFCLPVGGYKSWWDGNNTWDILNGARVVQMHIPCKSTCYVSMSCVQEAGVKILPHLMAMFQSLKCLWFGDIFCLCFVSPPADSANY